MIVKKIQLNLTQTDNNHQLMQSNYILIIISIVISILFNVYNYYVNKFSRLIATGKNFKYMYYISWIGDRIFKVPM